MNRTLNQRGKNKGSRSLTNCINTRMHRAKIAAPTPKDEDIYLQPNVCVQVMTKGHATHHTYHERWI